MDITSFRIRTIGFENSSRRQVKEIAVSKDYDCYEELIAPIENRMIRSIWRIVRDARDAEDTLQDALTIIWKKLDRIRKHPNPHALILKICTDASYDSLRKQKHKHKFENPETLGDLKANTTAAMDEMLRKETENEILTAITKLSKKQATAVLMRIVQEQPYDWIAQAMGCSETTVRIHVSRGREKLSRLLAHLAPSKEGQMEVSK